MENSEFELREILESIYEVFPKEEPTSKYNVIQNPSEPSLNSSITYSIDNNFFGRLSVRDFWTLEKMLIILGLIGVFICILQKASPE